MQAHAKPATDTPPAAPRNSIPGLFGEWIRQGAEGFIATQKILLDLVAQQNALALTIVRERIGTFSLMPSANLVDLAGKGLENFLEAQRVLLDLAARQNAIIAEGMRPGMLGGPAERVAEMMRQGIDNFITAQKAFLDMTETRPAPLSPIIVRWAAFPSTRVTDLARDGVRNFLESQKKFLDIVEEQVTRPRQAAKRCRTAAETGPVRTRQTGHRFPGGGAETSIGPGLQPGGRERQIRP